MNDGGPAFPGESQKRNSQGEWNEADWPGMSLLDHYAGEALKGFVSNFIGSLTPQQLAEKAFDQAEAMIAERAKRLARKDTP